MENLACYGDIPEPPSCHMHATAMLDEDFVQCLIKANSYTKLNTRKI